MSPLAIAILGGLGAMLGWGLADFFAKVSIDDIGELQSLAWGHLVGTTILAIATLGRAVWATDIEYGEISADVIGGLAFFGCLQAVVYYLLYKGFGKGQVAVLSPTFASFSGFVAIGSILFFDEVATAALVTALIVIFAGIILLSSDALPESGLKFFGAPGFREVMAATAFATVWTLGWDRIIGGRDPISFAFVMYAFMTAALFGVARFQKEALLPVSRSAWAPLAVIGCGETAAYASLSWAYSSTSLTSVVALLSGAFSLPTIILARVFLGDRLRGAQLWGAAAVLGGIMALALT